MYRKLLFSLLLASAGGINIGVFDPSGLDQARVISAVNGAQNIVVERVQDISVNSVRTAVAADNVAFIGVNSADDLYAIQEQLSISKTPLISTAVRPKESSFDKYPFVTSVQPPISEFATRLTEYATTHGTPNIALVHDGSAVSIEFAAQLMHLHDDNPSANRLIFHRMPTTAAERDALFISLKDDHIEVVAISSTDVQQVKELTLSAKLNVGRVWIVVQFQFDPEFESSVIVENLMQIRQDKVPVALAGTILTRALSAYTTNPPVPWNHGDPLLELIKNQIILQERSVVGFYICDTREWGLSSVTNWPLGQRNSKTGIRPMDGITFKVLFKISEPYLYENNGKYTGFIADFEKRIRTTLGYKAEVNYTNIAHGEAIKLAGKPYDIVFGDFSITDERQTLYDFTQPFLETSDSMIMRAPGNKDVYVQWLKPFSPAVWACWIGVWFIGACAYYIVGTSDTESNPEPVSREERIDEYAKLEENETPWCFECSYNKHTSADGKGKCRSCWNIFSALTNYLYLGFVTLFEGDGDAVATSRKFLMTAFTIAQLIFTSTYTAQLAALLAEKDLDYSVNTFSEIRYGEVALKDVTLPMDTSNQLRFDTTLNIEDLTNKGYVSAKNENDMVALIKSKKADVGIYDAIWTRWKATSDDGCNIVVHGDKWNRFGFGFVLPKSSPYTSLFTEVVLELRSDFEFISDLEAAYFIGNCPEIPTNDSGEVPKVDLSGFAVVWGIVLFCFLCSIAARILEHYHDIHQAKIKRKEIEIKGADNAPDKKD